MFFSVESIIHWISFRLHSAHQLAVCGCVCCVCTACLHRERESTPHLHSCSTHTCIPADTQTMKAHNSCEDSSKLQMNVYSLTYFILICNSQEAKQHSLLQMALDGHFSHIGLYKATGPSNSSVQNQDRDREQLPTSQTMVIVNIDVTILYQV